MPPRLSVRPSQLPSMPTAVGSHLTAGTLTTPLQGGRGGRRLVNRLGMLAAAQNPYYQLSHCVDACAPKMQNYRSSGAVLYRASHSAAGSGMICCHSLRARFIARHRAGRAKSINTLKREVRLKRVVSWCRGRANDDGAAGDRDGGRRREPSLTHSQEWRRLHMPAVRCRDQQATVSTSNKRWIS